MHGCFQKLGDAPGRGRWYAIRLIAALIGITTSSYGKDDGKIVTVDDRFVLRGSTWRGMGVNYFDAFIRAARDTSNRTYEDGFRVLDSLNIPFARVAFSGYAWKDMWVYRENKDAYFKIMDSVVSSAKQHNLRLVPSLIWNINLPPEMTGQKLGNFGDSQSLSMRWARSYVREVVDRYKGDTTILMWEIGNEFYPYGDLPKESRFYTPLNTPQIRGVLQILAREVAELDPITPISSGNQAPVQNQYHRYLFRKNPSLHKTMGIDDSPDEHGKAIMLLHPKPINVISSHLYLMNRHRTRRSRWGFQKGEFEYLRFLKDLGKRSKMPVFLGEYGVNDQDLDSTGNALDGKVQAEKLRRFIVSILEAGIPVSAIWVFDFKHYDPPGMKSRPGHPYWSITTSNDRCYQLGMVAAANSLLLSDPSGKTAASKMPQPVHQK